MLTLIKENKHFSFLILFYLLFTIFVVIYFIIIIIDPLANIGAYCVLYSPVPQI